MDRTVCFTRGEVHPFAIRPRHVRKQPRIGLTPFDEEINRENEREDADERPNDEVAGHDERVVRNGPTHPTIAS